MTKMLRIRPMALLTILLALAILAAGCGAKTEPSPAADPVTPVAQAAECPEVDQDVVVEEGLRAAAVGYFSPLPSDSNNIKAPDVQTLIDNKTEFFGIDIRRPEDYAKGHLPGFVNIPFGQVGTHLDQIPQDQLIIVQCYSGQTGSQVTGILRMLGYNAKNLHFGYNGVKDNELPIVQ